ESALFEEPAQADLDPRLICDRFTLRLILRDDLVLLRIYVHQLRDIRVTDRIDALDEVADTVRIHGPAEHNLRFDLIAFRYGDEAHIVAEARNLQRLALGECRRRTHPGPDPAACFRVFPMA